MGTQSPVGIQVHTAHAVETTRGSTRKLQQEEKPDKGQTYLPAVGVARELEVEAPGHSALVREVGFVREEDGGAFFRKPSEHQIQVNRTLLHVVHPTEVQRRSVSAQGQGSVAQFDHAAPGEDTPNRPGVRLVVVVTEDGDHSVGSVEAVQRSDESEGVPDQRTKPRVSSEVAGDRHEVRFFGVDEVNKPQDASGAHPIVRVEVADLSDLIPVEPGFETG